MIYKKKDVSRSFSEFFSAAKIVFYHKQGYHPYHFTALNIFPHVLYDTTSNRINIYYDI